MRTEGNGPFTASLTPQAPPLVIFQAEGLWRSVAGLRGITYSPCSWNSSSLPVTAFSVQIHQVSTRLTIPRGRRRQEGGLSTAVGYPLDTVKVRIQTEGHYNGIWHCIQETYRTERVLGFYKGVSASIFSVSLISSVSFGTYRNFLCNICKLRYGTADAKPSGLDVSLAGGAAGAVRVVLMTPSEVAKVRMQTQRNTHPSITSPQPLSKPKYRGSLHCLKVIAKEEGFGGLYKGCSALLCRDCSSSAIYFLTYSSLCDWLTPAGKNKPGFLVVLLSGGSAGVLAWGLATPMDVLKSRMQVDESGQHKYKGLIHCARESVRKEGLKVLFKGLGLNCIRAFPVNMVVFVTYEAVLRLTDHFTNKK
ncbi:solute carrier family 25 member 47 isoform X1 [Numida meleagris]|uniref:solute carrier family 25 member 47 isoform X1 n=2 Tax=Numida meleagris TaxID=8996 RepID=UPI000B3DB261|nr:solute carrier family 25 member 47 isoform X1 [Numida meleagris]